MRMRSCGSMACLSSFTNTCRLSKRNTPRNDTCGSVACGREALFVVQAPSHRRDLLPYVQALALPGVQLQAQVRAREMRRATFRCKCKRVWRSVVGMTRYTRRCPACNSTGPFERVDRRGRAEKWRAYLDSPMHRPAHRAIEGNVDMSMPDSGATKPGPAEGGMSAEASLCP